MAARTERSKTEEYLAKMRERNDRDLLRTVEDGGFYKTESILRQMLSRMTALYFVKSTEWYTGGELRELMLGMLPEERTWLQHRELAARYFLTLRRLNAVNFVRRVGNDPPEQHLNYMRPSEAAELFIRKVSVGLEAEPSLISERAFLESARRLAERNWLDESFGTEQEAADFLRQHMGNLDRLWLALFLAFSDAGPSGNDG
ncbi:MAG: hypothetical protein MMC33_001244 [Icmadophila ericetorum]|nr:hypothetical protein [Icmadophila ericetorum]